MTYDWKTPVSLMANERIQANYNEVLAKFDSFLIYDDEERGSGSPAEWMHERIEELEHEAKKRGIQL